MPLKIMITQYKFKKVFNFYKQVLNVQTIKVWRFFPLFILNTSRTFVLNEIRLFFYLIKKYRKITVENTVIYFLIKRRSIHIFT